MKEQKMRIAQIAAEMAPVAKIGGLADVILGLSKEIDIKGHPTTIILPKYDVLEYQWLEEFSLTEDSLSIIFENRKYENSIWKGTFGNLEVLLIEPHHPSNFFERGCIYGCSDDTERFSYFSKAAWQYILDKNSFDLVHIHDWQTAPIAILANEEAKKGKTHLPSLTFTIHNMEYQGHCSPSLLEKIGVDPSLYYTKEKLQDSTYPEALNLMKGGIIYSDYITTVSPTYAREIKETCLGKGLENLLNRSIHKFSGILNGIDYDYWNPATDPYLPKQLPGKPSQEASISTAIERKRYIKKALRQHLMLKDENRPIVGIIARLVPQKGVEIIKHSIKSVVEKGGQFVLLGSSPIESINREFHELKREYASNPHVSLSLQHVELIARLIFAGSDIFLVPSNFEPCGLTQMIALRYGTIPIVRETGGLKDSIFDVDLGVPCSKKGVGYTFESPTVESFDKALERAIQCWYSDPEKWEKMVLKGLSHDFSWKKSVEKYLDIYTSLTQEKVVY